MSKIIFFVIFLIFNSLFGLSALSVLIATIYLIIKLNFNKYIIIIGIMGILMAIIAVMGFFCKKRKILLIVYMVLISIIFLIECTLSVIFKLSHDFSDLVKKHIKDDVEFNEEVKDKIINLSFVILCTASALCLLSFLSSLFYFLKLINKEKKMKQEKNPEEMFKGLDYTNLNPDVTAMTN